MSAESYPVAPPAWARKDWLPERPSGTDLEIWCYADKFAYSPGDVIDLHVNTTGSTYSVEVIRDGADPRQVASYTNLPGASHPTPVDAFANGCGWPVSTTIPISGDLPSGLYLIVVKTTRGDVTVESEHFFVLRAATASANASMALVLTTSTLLAYNDWGGANHYRGLGDDPTVDVPSPISSMKRPIARGMLRKPANAPRNRNEDVAAPFDEPRYPPYEWARLNGYSRHHADAFWSTYERPFVVWAEQRGYSFDYLTQDDLHRTPGILDPYDCAVIVGHDEYWSWEMRDEIDRFVDGGGNIARFAANFDWQVRIENDKQIAFKAAAETDDPLFTTPDSHRSTTSWDHPVTGRPSATTFGLSGAAGVYAGMGGASPRGHGGLTVYRPEHWTLEGADTYYGDVIGAAPARIGTFEVDGCDYTFRDGLPYPTGRDGAPSNLEIIAMCPAVLFEEDHFEGRVPLADGGTASIDELEGVDWFRTASGYRRPKYGSGMMATFTRGKGTVFNSGTSEWVAGLIHGDWFVEKITANVLDRLGARGPKRAENYNTRGGEAS